MKYRTPPSLPPHPSEMNRTSEVAVAWSNSVLLIEDDPVIARAVQRQLRQSGFDVSRACRAGEVVALHQSFALGVFDIHLPESNGVELARMCLAQGIVRTVLFYSAADAGRLRTMAEGMGEFIEKQAGVSALVQRVLDHYNPSDATRRLIAVG